jgi:membrane-associated phospholipid phosphatase
LVRYGGLGAAQPPSGLIDLYAALPSLHVAWAGWCGCAIIRSSESRWRWLALAYPAATSFVVVATANHYVLDVVAGASLALLTLLTFDGVKRPRTQSG